jgi:glyoxylase-like metal-dependent hydrolase (beta-lactamase superfamily II)
VKISLGLVLWLCALTPSFAAAPAARTQAPGYYRMRLGDFEVTALNDGVVPFPAARVLTDVTPAEVNADLARVYLTDPVETSFNAFLINTGARLILIDTGNGTLRGPITGHLSENLRAAGYQPEQIDDVYITHMHGDHIGGLISGSGRAFPNAMVHAAKSEADYWLSQVNMAAASHEAKVNFQHAMDALAPYIAAGKFRDFEGDAELTPGIHALSAYGHTPGHTVYVVDSGGQRLLVWGDLIHIGAVQFEDPSATVIADLDPKAAATQRKRVLETAATGGYWVAGAHLSFPGIGHVRAEDGRRYRWIPVNYTIPY